ncbi:MAG: hypothetical protein P8Y54_14430 [Xanthomonadales bacterium]
MKKMVTKLVFVLFFLGSSLTVSSSLFAQDWPMVGGDYWEVSAIDVKDGAGIKYARWLATEWRKNLEFAKSKGWIKDYMVLSNVYERKGEPSLYLIRVMESIPTGAESEERGKQWVEWMNKTVDKMQEESGNRAEYREVMSESLLQRMHFRD